MVGELYDGTTHLFVKQSKYRQIKNEIEERVDETLPDVAQFRDVTIIKRRISFQGFQSYRDFDNVLREKKPGSRKKVRKLLCNYMRGLSKLSRGLLTKALLM